MRTRDEIEVVDRATVQRLLAAGEAVLIEVLPEPEYARLHLRGAVNIPLERIGRTCRKRFSRRQRLIVYCSNTGCPTSELAARKLRTFGFRRVLDYAGGKEDWEQAGLPVDSGPEE